MFKNLMYVFVKMLEGPYLKVYLAWRFLVGNGEYALTSNSLHTLMSWSIEYEQRCPPPPDQAKFARHAAQLNFVRWLSRARCRRHFS